MVAPRVAGIHASIGADNSAFNRAIDDSRRRWDRFVGAVGRGLQFGAGFGVGLRAFQSVATFADEARKSVIGYNMAIENATLATRVLTGSLEKGQALVDELQRSALRPLFGFQGLTETTVQMLRFGIALNQVIPLQERIADVAAASGDRMVENQKRITWAIGQTVAKGRVLQEELNQLQEAGVNTGEVLAIAGEMTGKSFKQIQEIMSKGELSPRLLMAAFEEWASRRMPNLAKQMVETTSGAVAVIRNQFEYLGSIIGKPLYDRFSTMVKNLANALKSPAIEQWAEEMAARVELVMKAFDALGQTVAIVFQSIYQVVKSVGSTIHELLMLLSPFTKGSPSLVESFTLGFQLMEGTAAEFVDKVSVHFDRLSGKIEQLKKSSAAGVRIARGREIDEEGKEVSKILGPTVASQYVQAKKELMDFMDEFKPLQDAIREQEAAIKVTELALRPYARAVEEAARALSLISAQYNRAEAALRRYQSVPLAGEKALSDKMFANETETARLQLRLVQMRIRGGGRIQNRRLARQLEKQIAQRNLRGEEMQLEQRVKFAPLRKALEDLGLPKELSFEEAFKNAKAAADEIDRLGPLLKTAQDRSDAVTAEYENQSEALFQQKMALEDMEARWGVVEAKARSYQSILDLVADTIKRESAAAAKTGSGQFGADVKVPEKILEAQKKLQVFTADFLTKMEEWKRRLFVLQLKLREFEGYIKSFSENIIRHLDPLKQALTPLFTDLRGVFRELLEGDLTGAISTFLVTLRNNKPLLTKGLTEFRAGFIPYGEALWDWISPQLEPALKELGALGEAIVKKLGEWAPLIPPALATAQKKLWEWIGPSWDKMKTESEALLKRFTDWISDPTTLLKIETATEKFITPLLSFLGRTTAGFIAGATGMADDWAKAMSNEDLAVRIGVAGGKAGAAFIKGFWSAFQAFDKELTANLLQMLEEFLSQITIDMWDPIKGWHKVRLWKPEFIGPRPNNGFTGGSAGQGQGQGSRDFPVPPNPIPDMSTPPPPRSDRGGGRAGTIMSVNFHPGSVQVDGNSNPAAVAQLEEDIMKAFETFMMNGVAAGLAVRAPIPGAVVGVGR